MTKAPTPELRKLIDRLLAEGGLGRVETSRLEELLKDKDALRYYSEVMSQEAMMAEALAGIEVEEPKLLRFPVKAAAFAAAAASVVFAVGFFAGRSADKPALVTAPKASAVQVTGLMGVEWEKAGAPVLISGGVAAERVAFRSGLVELTYGNGVRVTLEGPADYSVMSPTSGNLANGKLVAYVPPGAEGFSVDYAKGKVVDLGTEFAMDVSADGTTELGVFDGEVELHLPGEKPRPLFQSQAVLHDSTSERALRAIPLDREKFVRRLPARDFRWSVTSASEQEIEFDVTHLIWKPSQYRAIFKWVDGRDAILVSNVELRLNGVPIASDLHEGATGALKLVRDNLYRLNLDSEKFARGRWTLHATVKAYPRLDEMAGYTGPVESQGILQFEEGLVSKATEKDFIGRWGYHFLGKHFIREFHPDGSVSLTRDGAPYKDAFVGSTWEMEDGVLKVWIPDQQAFENHVLRDADTLIFTCNPYDNAGKMREE